MRNDIEKARKEPVPPERKEKKSDKGFWIGFGICFAVNALLTVLIVFYEIGALQSQWEMEKWTILVDGFTLSGGAMCLLYLLIWVSGEGAFDAIGYGVKLAYYTTFHKNLRETKLAKNYTEYRMMKRDKEKTDVRFLLISGGVFLLVGLFLLIPYSIFM